ncbi:ABC transporter permease [Roseicella frigidaeris]|uniref:ABC transporter permease n=1 Tax=Roseicella frigidaeris TaxID=2230885 RepID=A0A327MCP2_9PROT|nr:ABC transporter permease [Roseicella frigidaeris]RAI60042.1 ABC transporter permease [Roseicella frigidaeris]
MQPLRPVSPGARLLLGAGFFAVFLGLWLWVTEGGHVPALFLASPGRTLAAGWSLLTEYGFLGDIAVTVFRVVGGFLIAAAFAVPLGLLMGAFKPVEAFFEPFFSFARYLPASAFIPLLILWAGVGEAQKLAVIVIGSVFQLVIMVAVIAGGTRMDLVEAAYTLGSRPLGILRRVVIPAAAPQVAETLRLVLGWAWTYVIVAELIGASSGIGHMIMDSQRLLDTGQMIFGIVVIGVIGLVTDFAVKLLNRRLFPWAAL